MGNSERSGPKIGYEQRFTGPMTFSIARHRRISARTVFTVALALSLSIGCRSFRSKPEPSPYPSTAPAFSAETTVSDQPPALILGTSPPSSAMPLPGPTDRSTYSPPLSMPETAPVTEQRVDAFRPIMPNATSQRIVLKESSQAASPAPAHSAAKVVPPETQKNLDQLQARITALEKKLSETEQELHTARRPAPMVDSTPAPAPQPVSPAAKPASPPKLPSLAIAGVSSVTDQDKVRIRIVDAALFHAGTWDFNPEAENSLRKIAGELRACYPSASIEIEGHTDSLQVDPRNKTQKHDIASFKSTLIMQYFVNTLLWEPDKIKSSSYGPSRPMADNGTPEGRAQNNRIEIVVSP